MNTAVLTAQDAAPDPGRVLAKAAYNAGAELGLTQRELGDVIGLSGASVSRMRHGGFDLSGKPMELAICLVRVFRSLDAIVGGDPDTMKAWMRNPNSDLGRAPKVLIAQAAGLVDVMNYLDAARAPT